MGPCVRRDDGGEGLKRPNLTVVFLPHVCLQRCSHPPSPPHCSAALSLLALPPAPSPDRCGRGPARSSRRPATQAASPALLPLRRRAAPAGRETRAGGFP